MCQSTICQIHNIQSKSLQGFQPSVISTKLFSLADLLQFGMDYARSKPEPVIISVQRTKTLNSRLEKDADDVIKVVCMFKSEIYISY